MQQKIDPIVRKETAYIAMWTLIFSLVMQAVFLIIDRWDYTVLLGNLLGGCATIANFLMLGITVQRAVTKDEKEAGLAMKLSNTLRTFFLFVVALLGVLLPCFNTWTVLIPLFFTRLAVMIRPLWDKKYAAKEDNNQ